ncbi:hypothetical protein [Paenibacillus amylolyticus]|uniref:hypothetical protein n=1 Tax=Paenibacillus amylolyticus TaxID=1451 RepID=UPI00249C1A7C|nr:hypothetical protein [Paenibacillus amylolyticus]WFA87247.1 hypothetical protein OGI70_10195 [Paenibacillus amylolyticus]
MRISKTFKKIVLLGFFVVPLSLGLLQTDADAVRYSGGRSTAINDVWYSDSVSSYGYVSAFDEARFRWNETSSKVNLKRVLSSSGTPDKYYVGVSSIPYRFGYYTPYKLSSSGGYVEANHSDTWAFSNVSIYYNNMERADFKTDEVISNAGHEIGHSIGLDHTPSDGANSIMRSGIQNIGPTTYDITEIRLKRGN